MYCFSGLWFGESDLLVELMGSTGDAGNGGTFISRETKVGMEGWRELKPSAERSESGARGASRNPCGAAEACKAGPRGVRVLNRHLG